MEDPGDDDLDFEPLPTRPSQVLSCPGYSFSLPVVVLFGAILL